MCNLSKPRFGKRSLTSGGKLFAQPLTYGLDHGNRSRTAAEIEKTMSCS